MKVMKVTGDTLDDLIRNVAEQIQQMVELDNGDNVSVKRDDKRPTNSCKEHHCECHTTPDISKIYWIDKRVNNDEVITIFNVIAPFAIEKTIKATLNKVEGDTWLTLRYTNDDSMFTNCQTCNFKARKEIEYKYNFTDYKVSKKALKLTYKNGIISLFTVSTKAQPKNEDYVIGL